jgi:hypothetical protein
MQEGVLLRLLQQLRKACVLLIFGIKESAHVHRLPQKSSRGGPTRGVCASACGHAYLHERQMEMPHHKQRLEQGVDAL